MEIQELVGIGLEGGTLVEYKGNTGFSLEYGRAVIVSIVVSDEKFSIETDNPEAYMGLSLSKMARKMGYVANVRRFGPVYLIDSPMGWNYVLAPKGIEIPKRPGWMDVSEEEFLSEVERHLKGDSSEGASEKS